MHRLAALAVAAPRDAARNAEMAPAEILRALPANVYHASHLEKFNLARSIADNSSLRPRKKHRADIIWNLAKNPILCDAYFIFDFLLLYGIFYLNY